MAEIVSNRSTTKCCPSSLTFMPNDEQSSSLLVGIWCSESPGHDGDFHFNDKWGLAWKNGSRNYEPDKLHIKYDNE
jgi:hypothetical protein